jgi:hypothetical protein
MIFRGRRQLQYVINEYVRHHHSERNYQGVDNRLLFPADRRSAASGSINRRRRLGGLLSLYSRGAA